VVCIYLTGSLLQETPMIGGSADIDLVIVHSNDPIVERELSLSMRIYRWIFNITARHVISIRANYAWMHG